MQIDANYAKVIETIFLLHFFNICILPREEEEEEEEEEDGRRRRRKKLIGFPQFTSSQFAILEIISMLI